MDAAASPRVRRRQIEAGDLPAVVALLRRGFPGRPEAYWERGLARQGGRALPDAYPRYGFLLEAEGVPVGALLTFHTASSAQDGAAIRCNLSSWYVEPAYRIHAPQLMAAALRRQEVTYLNISPAPHTYATIEAQGFTPYVFGQFLAVPMLAPSRSGMQVEPFGAGLKTDLSAPEEDVLADHAGFGCLSLVVRAPDGAHPFVFLPFRARSGRLPLPLMQLIFCREVGDFVHCAGPIGRFLLARGFLGVILDADGPVDGLAGHYRAGMGRKYFRGPARPRIGDLSYTERVILGP